MKKDTWTWGIGTKDGAYYVFLEKGSLWDEILATLAGWCFNQGSYRLWRLGERLVEKTENSRKEVARLPVSYVQAVELGWSLESDDDPRCEGCGEPKDNGKTHGYFSEFGGCV